MNPESRVSSGQANTGRNGVLWTVIILALLVSIGAALMAMNAKKEVTKSASVASSDETGDELQIVSLGDGLRLENGVLKNSGVVSVGGQTGNVQLSQTQNPQSDAVTNQGSGQTTIVRSTQTVVKEPVVNNTYESTTVVQQPQPADQNPTLNTATIKTSTNTTAAFAVQRASGADLLTADTLNNVVTIGGQTTIAGGTKQATDTISTNNLMAEYLFEEGSGVTSTDSSANGNDAIAAQNQTPALTFPKWNTDSKVGAYSLEFDGKTGIDLPNTPENTIGNSNFTLETWVKFSGSNNNVYYNAVVAQRAGIQSAADPDWAFFWGRSHNLGGNRMIFNYTENGRNSAQTLNGNSTLQSERWYHVAVTYDGSQLRQYIDGKLDGILNTTFSMHESSQPINVGYTHDLSPTKPMTYFYGKLDNLRMYKRALLRGEIENTFKTGVAEKSLTVSGNVGIGTNEALYALQVQGNDIAAVLQANDVTLDNEFQNSPTLQLGATYDADTTSGVRSGTYNSTIQTVVTAGGASPTGRLAFSSGTGVNILNVLSTGQVGIGTITPGEKLTVANGNIAIEAPGVSLADSLPQAGGSLPAGVYFYKVSTSDGSGVSLPTNEVSCASDGVTTRTCPVTVASLPASVSSMRVYRGTTSHGQNQYINVAAKGGTSFNFIDDGTLTWTNGTPPSTSNYHTVRLNGNGSSIFTGGNVGIGTNAPGSLLTVIGSQPNNATGNGVAAIQAFNVTGGKGGNTTGTSGQTAGAGGSIVLASGAGGDAASGSTNGSGGAITIQGGAAGAGTGTAGSRGQISMQASGGNVGIGLTASATGARLQVSTGGTANVGVVVTGFAGQTADLIQAKNSSGTNLLTLSATGVLTVTTATVTNLTVTHLAGAGATPTIAAGTGACTTPTVSVTGTDTAGTITVTTGTGCSAAGMLARVTFASAYTAAPRVVLTPATQTAATMPTFVNSSTTSTTLFEINNTAAATNSTTYRWYYMVIQ